VSFAQERKETNNPRQGDVLDQRGSLLMLLLDIEGCQVRARWFLMGAANGKETRKSSEGGGGGRVTICTLP
jgi:hypothetical protein